MPDLQELTNHKTCRKEFINEYKNQTANTLATAGYLPLVDKGKKRRVNTSNNSGSNNTSSRLLLAPTQSTKAARNQMRTKLKLYTS